MHCHYFILECLSVMEWWSSLVNINCLNLSSTEVLNSLSLLSRSLGVTTDPTKQHILCSPPLICTKKFVLFLFLCSQTVSKTQVDTDCGGECKRRYFSLPTLVCRVESCLKKSQNEPEHNYCDFDLCGSEYWISLRPADNRYLKY